MSVYTFAEIDTMPSHSAGRGARAIPAEVTEALAHSLSSGKALKAVQPSLDDAKRLKNDFRSAARAANCGIRVFIGAPDAKGAVEIAILAGAKRVRKAKATETATATAPAPAGA